MLTLGYFIKLFNWSSSKQSSTVSFAINVSFLILAISQFLLNLQITAGMCNNTYQYTTAAYVTLVLVITYIQYIKFNDINFPWLAIAIFKYLWLFNNFLFGEKIRDF